MVCWWQMRRSHGLHIKGPSLKGFFCNLRSHDHHQLSDLTVVAQPVFLGFVWWRPTETWNGLVMPSGSSSAKFQDLVTMFNNFCKFYDMITWKNRKGQSPLPNNCLRPTWLHIIQPFSCLSTFRVGPFHAQNISKPKICWSKNDPSVKLARNHRGFCLSKIFLKPFILRHQNGPGPIVKHRDGLDSGFSRPMTIHIWTPK